MLYDLIIKNGLVIDGTGEPGRAADVAVAAGEDSRRSAGSASPTPGAS